MHRYRGKSKEIKVASWFVDINAVLVGRRVHASGLFLLAILTILDGCSVLNIKDTLPHAIMNQDDPQVIQDGAPAFLIIMDAMVEADPSDSDYLMLAAQLYGTYASAFASTDEKRSQILAQRAFDYGYRGLCNELEQLCESFDGPYETFHTTLLKTTDESDLAILFGFVGALSTWMQANSGNWKAAAQLPKLKDLVKYILSLDETYENGAAHLYMGVLESQLPPALGGKPEKARKHFQRAIELSSDRNLLAKVLYAENYARTIFDRELHDRLLIEVIDADPKTENLTLTNTLAQNKARILLDESNSYFE